MELSFDKGGSRRLVKCPTCKSKNLELKRFILDRGNAYAICKIEANRHNNVPEFYITASLGTWENEKDGSRIAFACRYGFVAEVNEYACTLLDVSDNLDSFTGKKMTRNEGLKHPSVTEFWHIVDFVLDNDMDIHDFVHHPLKSKLKNVLF